MSKFKVIYDGGDFTDGFEVDSLENGLECAKEILLQWAAEEMSDWPIDDNYIPRPTDEQIESWDYMVDSCWVDVIEYEEDDEDWRNTIDYFLTYEEYEEINFIPWEDLKKKYNW